MILYFTGTGNSLAISRKIADSTGDTVMSMANAADFDLSAERCVGLVYPCYDFNTPPAVRELVPRLRISTDAYVFIVVSCGAQTGNAIWTVRRLLQRQGVRVAYCHKVRMPDNSAVVFGRNPNDQLWKLDRFAPRIDRIISDVKARRRGNHYGAPGLAGWIAGLPALERKLLGSFKPKVNPDRCVGCGACAKTCPIGNIGLAEGKAAIGSACTACLGCLHTCQHQAIEVGGKPTPKEHQYRHPSAR